MLPLAILVLTVDRLGGYSALTNWTATAFFWLRIAHAAGMISEATRLTLRPVIFTVGWVCCLVMAYAAYVA